MIRFENEFGFGYKNEKYICFFGNVLATDLSLEKQFPEFKFLRIKQTHSDIIRPADDSLFEADAHYADQKNLALRIQTADCMPIMIFCEQTNRIAAVHAGWRGVVNNITQKTITYFVKTGSTEKKFQIFVGPSIQQKSFEVDEDVFNQLIIQNEKNYIQQNSKYYVDLNALLLN